MEEDQTKPKQKRTYDPILPPCRICNAKASGYHFGVISCEACKVFYRRSLSALTPYVCTKQKTCEIKPNRRLSCSFCRLQKCIALGMSKESIKLGRYPSHKKTLTVQEVKSLEAKQRQEEEEKEKKKQDRTAQLEAMVEKMVAVEKNDPFIQPEAIAAFPEMRAKYHAMVRARHEVFGVQAHIPFKVYKEFYNSTGIDIDDRKRLMEKCVTSSEEQLVKYITHVKELPGFTELDFEDQVILLRAGTVEWYSLASIPAYDCENETFLCSACGSVFGHPELQMLYNSNDYMSAFAMAKTLQDLDLRSDELAMFKGIVIFNTEEERRGKLKNAAQVEKLRDDYIEALKLVLERNRGVGAGAAIAMGKMIHSLTELQLALKKYYDLKDFWFTVFPDIEFPKLLLELLGPEDGLALAALKIAETNTGPLDLTNPSADQSRSSALGMQDHEAITCSPPNKVT